MIGNRRSIGPKPRAVTVATVANRGEDPLVSRIAGCIQSLFCKSDTGRKSIRGFRWHSDFGLGATRVWRGAAGQ